MERTGRGMMAEEDLRTSRTLRKVGWEQRPCCARCAVGSLLHTLLC